MIKKIYWWAIALGIPLQFILFKLRYPYPNFRQDSSAYIGAAIYHSDATQWPVGYSKFLAIIHFFSHSDLLVVCIQYLLLEGGALLFLFTIQRFLKVSEIVFAVLLAFIVFNPMFLHLGNYIMSDGLFISLSFFWVTQLIWIIFQPTRWQILSHVVLLFCLFTVRYNALFYPFLSVVILLVCSQPLRVRLTGIVLTVLLIGAFIWHTENKFEELAGVRQFSPFSGWQLANNACICI